MCLPLGHLAWVPLSPPPWYIVMAEPSKTQAAAAASPMPVQDSNILFLFFFPWKQIGSWESLYRNVPVPHYGSSGAVTRVGLGQTPTHFFIHSDSSLALITMHRKGQPRFCWGFRTNPRKHSTIFPQAPPPASMLCPTPFITPSTLFLLGFPSCSLSPLTLSLWLRSQSKLATRANWNQVGRKAAKKFQNGKGGSSELFSPGGERGPHSALHTLFRKRWGDLEATLGWPRPSLQLLLAGCTGRSRVLYFPQLFFLLGYM